MVATVEVIERVGGGNTQVAEHVHLLGEDVFSGGPLEFGLFPLRPNIDGGWSYSYERWLRLRFQPPFTYVYDFFFWTPDLVVPDNWAIRYGTSQEPVTATNAPSSIAVNPLPTSKPEEPNIGGVIPLDGTGLRYSDWIVLQASVNGDASFGPMLGFTGNEPASVRWRFDWTET